MALARFRVAAAIAVEPGQSHHHEPRAGTALLLALATFAVPATVRAQVVHSDFEDGTTQGWVRRGTAILTVTSEAAAAGLNSLKTTGRPAPWNGPTLNVMPVIQKDLLYQIRVSVRLTADSRCSRTPSG